MTKATTLKDVAREAGVDPSTVSRVLNGKAQGKVRPETRERIETAARKLSYKPNVQARSLRQKQSRTIAAVIPDLVSPHIPEMLEGISAGAAAREYTVFISYLDQRSARQEQHLALLHESRVDGLILITDTLKDSVIAELAENRHPFVLVNQRAAVESHYVMMDDAAGMEMAVEYLAELGHRRIAHLSGELTVDCALRRFQGYRRGLDTTGLAYDTQLMEESTLVSWAGGKAAMERLLSRGKPPTALVAANIVIATGAMAAIREAGLRVPEDISVIGLQDAPLAEVLEPPLTVVEMPLFEMGRTAADALIDLLAGKTDTIAPGVLSPKGLRIRKTTGPGPGRR